MAAYIRAGGGEIHYRTEINDLVIENNSVKSARSSTVPPTATRRCNICGMLIHDDHDHANCPFCGAHGENLQAIGETERTARDFIADHFICAMDVPGVQKLVMNSPALQKEDYFSNVLKLGTTSVYVVDLWYNDDQFWPRRLESLQKDCAQFFATGFEYLGQTINWARLVSNGRHFLDVYQDIDNVSVLETHIAAAEKVSHLPDKAIADAVHAELATIFKDIPPYQDFYINKWYNYTAYKPGTEAFRPTVESPIPNLLLIGDWVNIDSPAVFMEKTNIAAKQACNAILKRDGVADGHLEIINSGVPMGIGNLLRHTTLT